MKDAESRVMLEASGKGDGGRAANVRAADEQLVHERKVRTGKEFQFKTFWQ
jgi:hypothetical protein